MLQSTFFNAQSKINQSTIDLLEQFIDAASMVRTPKFSNDTTIIMTSVATNLVESVIQSGDLIVYHDVIVPMITDVSLLLEKVERKTEKISLLEIQYIKEKVTEAIASKYTDKSQVRIGELRLLRHLHLGPMLERIMDTLESKILLKDYQIKDMNKIGRGQEID